MKRILSFVLGVAVAGSALVSQADVISEFQPNPVGGDPTEVSFELGGVANSSFDLWILSVEGDSSSSFGVIDRAANVTGTYLSNGLAEVLIPDLENPSFTVILVEGFSGLVGDSIDTNSDGIVDNTPWTTFMDALGIPDTASGEMLYGAQLGGQDFSYTGDEPKLVFRDGTTGDWYAANDPDNGEIYDINATDVLLTGTFDADPFTPTFGTVNPSYTFTAIPEPGMLGFLVVGMVGMAVRRRRS